MPSALQQRQSIVNANRRLSNLNRDELDTMRVSAAQCGLAVDVVAVPIGISDGAARNLSSEALNHLLNDCPTETTFVMPHVLRHADAQSFDAAIAAYDSQFRS